MGRPQGGHLGIALEVSFGSFVGRLGETLGVPFGVGFEGLLARKVAGAGRKGIQEDPYPTWKASVALLSGVEHGSACTEMINHTESPLGFRCRKIGSLSVNQTF